MCEMPTTGMPAGQEAREEREAAAASSENGVFEIDTSSGSIEWANVFAQAVTGCSTDQLASMSVFDITPERFHERIREDLAGGPGRYRRFYLLPTVSADGGVAWWYVFKTRSSGTRRWCYGEHVSNTPRSGPEFSFMAMQADLVESQAAVEDRSEELEKWIQEQISRVETDVESLRSRVGELATSVEKAESAALLAAAESVAARNASLATQRELSKEMQKYATKVEIEDYFRKFTDFEEQNTNTSAEILKLIKSDNEQKERARAYEEHVKKTTQSAIKVIEAQAEKSGKGLSRKVTVPLFVITGLAMVIQYLIQHWGAIAPHLGL